MQKNAESHLGDFLVPKESFPKLKSILADFKGAAFERLNISQKTERVSRALLDCILEAPQPAFLLPCVVEYLERVEAEQILEHYTFANFELWLNQLSGLSAEENYRVRARIVGKWVPRGEYQMLFPVGMGKSYPGSHFVTAHQSPDLDTTIASFWGWIDAFGARVSEGMHIWNVPGGPPAVDAELSLLFYDIFGRGVFSHLAKTRSSLAVSSLDLMTQKGMIRQHIEESIVKSDHERAQNAIVLVDEKGFYLGDWRSFDVEGVRQILVLLNGYLRWFENQLHARLITLFERDELKISDLPDFFQELFGLRLKESQPIKELSEKYRMQLENYLRRVLHVKKGIESTFREFASAMREQKLVAFELFVDLTEALSKSSLFDESGRLLENRPAIFQYLGKILQSLDKAILSLRVYTQQLDIALRIKKEVFGHLPHVISFRDDIEEIRSKIGDYPSLTVTYADKEGRLLPLGIVHASDIHKPVLGTVTLRDFCNREETKVPSYLEVISVIDHHKTALQTYSPPVAIISDAQSSNVLVAELAFAINDKYSTGGMTNEQIAEQLAAVAKNLSGPSQKRLMQRLLQRQMAAEKQQEFFIDPRREYIEYLHFLYAIFDDTDLLTKVSHRDVECVVSVINRLKSLSLKKEVEVLFLDDLPRDASFVANAAERILRHPETYSLYRKIYLAKEKSAEENILLCTRKEPSAIFADTKEQNGCCRIGQTKLFSKNFPFYYQHAAQLRMRWYEAAEAIAKEKKDVDLHIHMISTIASAEDLFAGKTGDYAHRDEMWIWIPSTEQATEHLKSFLNAFRSVPALAKDKSLEVEFLGKNAKELEEIFLESFLPGVPRIITDTPSLPIAIMRFKAGLLNSRKAMVSPYLPKL